MAEIVNATPAHIQRLYAKPLPRTARVIAAVEGETVLGITGFYPQDGRIVLFAGIADEARSQMKRHKRTLIACARKIMGMVAERKTPVFACADPKIAGSDVLLKHLGFEHDRDDIWLTRSVG